MDFLDEIDFDENVEQYEHLLQCESCTEKGRLVENLKKELAIQERRVLQYTAERNYYIDLAASNWENGDKLEHESAVNAAKLAQIDETVQELCRQGFEYSVHEYTLIGLWKEYDRVKQKLESQVKELNENCAELAEKSLLVSTNCDKLVAEITEQDEEVKTAKMKEKESIRKISLVKRTFSSKIKKVRKDLSRKVKASDWNVIQSIVNNFEKEKLKSLDEDSDMDEEESSTHTSSESENNIKDNGMDENDSAKHITDQLEDNIKKSDEEDEEEIESNIDNIKDNGMDENDSAKHITDQLEYNIKKSDEEDEEEIESNIDNIKDNGMDENDSAKHITDQLEDNIKKSDEEDEEEIESNIDNIKDNGMDENDSAKHITDQLEDKIEESDMDEEESPIESNTQSEDNINDSGMDENDSAKHITDQLEDKIEESDMGEKDSSTHASAHSEGNIEDIDMGEKNSPKLISDQLEDSIDSNDIGEIQICDHFVNRDLESVGNSVNRHVTPVQSSQLLHSPVLQTNNIDGNDVAVLHNDIADADEDASYNLNLGKSDHSDYINLETATDFSEDDKLHAGKSKEVYNVEVNDVQASHSIRDIEAARHPRSDDDCGVPSCSNNIQSSVPEFVGKQSLEPLNENQNLCCTDMDLGEDISGNMPEQATEDYSHSEEEEEACSLTYAQKNKWRIFSRTPVTPVSPEVPTVAPDITYPSEHVTSGPDVQNSNLEHTTVSVMTQIQKEMNDQETALDVSFYCNENQNHISSYPENSGLSSQNSSSYANNNIASSCNISTDESSGDYPADESNQEEECESHSDPDNSRCTKSCDKKNGTQSRCQSVIVRHAPLELEEKLVEVIDSSASNTKTPTNLIEDILTHFHQIDFSETHIRQVIEAIEKSENSGLSSQKSSSHSNNNIASSCNVSSDESSGDLPADESNQEEKCGSHSDPDNSRCTKSCDKKNGTQSRCQPVIVRHVPLALEEKLVKVIESSASNTETPTKLFEDILTYFHQIDFSETHIRQVIEAIEKSNRSNNTENYLTFYATRVKKSCTECSYGIDKSVKNDGIRKFNNIQLSKPHLELNECFERHVKKSRKTLFGDRPSKRRRLKISSSEKFPKNSLTENSMSMVNGLNNFAGLTSTVVAEDIGNENSLLNFVNNEASYDEEFIQNVTGRSGYGDNSGNKKYKVTNTICKRLSKIRTEHSAAEKITNSKTLKEMNTVSEPETTLEFSNSRVRPTQSESSQMSHSTHQDESELQIDYESDDDKSCSSFGKNIQILDRCYEHWIADKMKTPNKSVSKELNQDSPKLSSRKLLYSKISKRWMFSDEPVLSENELDISTGCEKEHSSNSSVNLNVVINDVSLPSDNVLNISSKDSQSTDVYNVPKQKDFNEISNVNKKVSCPFKLNTSSANRGEYNIDVSGLENTFDNSSLRTFDQVDQSCSIPTADTSATRVIESDDDSVLCDAPSFDTLPETLVISQENKDVLRWCMERYEDKIQRKPYDFQILNDIHTMVTYLQEIEMPFPNRFLFLPDLLKINREVLIAFTVLRLEKRYDSLTWSRLVELYACYLSDQIQDILYNIQVRLFYLRKNLSPDYIVINLTNFYVNLCLKIEDYSRIEKLAVDSFYCLKSNACIVVKEILKLYPLLLPPADNFKKEKSLLIFVLLDTLFHTNNRKAGAELLKILREKYSYKWEKQKNDEVATTLLNNLECNSLFHLEPSIIIFSKRITWHCSNFYLLQNGFYPLIDNWLRGNSELSEEAVALSVRCLAYVARGFPTNGRESLAEKGIQTVSDKLMCLSKARNMSEIVKKSLYFALVCHGHEDFENMMTVIFKLDLRDLGEELLSRFLYYQQHGFWCENFSFLKNCM